MTKVINVKTLKAAMRTAEDAVNRLENMPSDTFLSIRYGDRPLEDFLGELMQALPPVYRIFIDLENKVMYIGKEVPMPH